MNKKRIYITGGSSGIGLALARTYTREGNDIVLLARDTAKLAQAVAECRQLKRDAGQHIHCESLDITAYRELQSTMDAVVEQHGLPDLIILCAGVAGNKRFLDCGAAEFDSMMDINLAGSREVVRSLLPAMLRRGSGQLAFVSSMAGLVGTLKPEIAAAKIASGLRRGSALIIPGVRASMVAWIARHFPGLFSKWSTLLLYWKFGRSNPG